MNTGTNREFEKDKGRITHFRKAPLFHFRMNQHNRTFSALAPIDLPSPNSCPKVQGNSSPPLLYASPQFVKHCQIRLITGLLLGDAATSFSELCFTCS